VSPVKYEQGLYITEDDILDRFTLPIRNMSHQCGSSLFKFHFQRLGEDSEEPSRNFSQKGKCFFSIVILFAFSCSHVNSSHACSPCHIRINRGQYATVPSNYNHNHNQSINQYRITQAGIKLLSCQTERRTPCALMWVVGSVLDRLCGLVVRVSGW
jgi:hypothetical protein